MNPEIVEVDEDIASLFRKHPPGNVRLHLERQFEAPWATRHKAIVAVQLALHYLRSNPRDTEIRDMATKAWKRWTGGDLEKVIGKNSKSRRAE